MATTTSTTTTATTTAVPEQKLRQAFANTLTTASLFSNCIEAVGLILPYHEGRNTEEIFLGKIAIQQARLLAWGDTVGVTSPPVLSGITHAIPKNPGLTNPDPTVPIYFGHRDARLDDEEVRAQVEQALHGIAEPLFLPNGNNLKKHLGLQFYKPIRMLADQPLLDVSRLEACREKATLLEEVARPFGEFPRKRDRTLMYRYYIHDEDLFMNYLNMMRDNIDFVIQLAGVQQQVDRAMKMDLRAMGWHPSPNASDIARMTWKLGILHDGCRGTYPEYADAATEALDSVLGQWKGMQGYETLPDHKNPLIVQATFHSTEETSPRPEALRNDKTGFFHLRPKFLRRESNKEDVNRRRSYDDSIRMKKSDAPRSNSVSVTMSGKPVTEQSLDPPRSKSIHAMTQQELQKSHPEEEITELTLTRTQTKGSMIDRHDMFQGPFRTETKK